MKEAIPFKEVVKANSASVMEMRLYLARWGNRTFDTKFRTDFVNQWRLVFYNKRMREFDRSFIIDTRNEITRAIINNINNSK